MTSRNNNNDDDCTSLSGTAPDGEPGPASGSPFLCGAAADACRRAAMRLVDHVPSGLVVLDLAGRIQSINCAARDLLGLTAPQRLEGQPLAGLVQDAELAACIGEALADPRYHRVRTLALPTPGGAPRHLACAVYRTLLEGQPMVMVVAEDVTAAIDAQATLRDSEERARLAFDHAAVGLAHITPAGHWLRVNRHLADILGYAEAELLRLRVQDVTPAEDLAQDQLLRGRVVEGSLPSYSREKRFRHHDGHLVWVNVTVAPTQGPAGVLPNLTVVVEEISHRKHAEERLRHLANHDPLTGLYNRALLHDRLAQATTYARRSGRHAAVLFIDLDRFKNINDSLGHDAGDSVLVEVARRLSASVRSGDTVARLGGDEFVVVLADVAQEDEIAALARKVLDALTDPYVVGGQELSPAGSIGISVYPRDGDNSAALLGNADAAMYRAKKKGSGNFQFYQPSMNARALERLKLEGGLRRAIERKEFVLHYQPQIDIASGAITGVEALLRWQPPGQAMVLPDDFIPIAEETGLIVPIGEWVLRTACAQQVAWEKAGLGRLRMAVNLSARQFRQQDLHPMVADVLTDTGCAPGMLELEITESVVMDDPEAAAHTLKQLTGMGVQLSIDDFGTGYSSLSYLKRFPIHALKIDRSFVRDIPSDANDAAIATAVIALAHSMKLTVVAEGVETVEQLEFLRALHCDAMQGYLCGRPMPAEELAKLLSMAG
jgi:diguanylate cyclase (GGDEF)-like protein/PAS domain S-box-containing protein